MFCVQCGQSLPDEGRFCPQCGTKFVQAEKRPGTMSGEIQTEVSEAAQPTENPAVLSARFQVLDDVFPEPTQQLIIAGLKSLEYDGIAFLDIKNGDFYQTHNLGDGYRIAVESLNNEDGGIVCTNYEPLKGNVSLKEVISIFTSPFRNISWRELIQWNKISTKIMENDYVRPPYQIEDKDPDDDILTASSEFFGAKFYTHPRVRRSVLRDLISDELLKRENALVGKLSVKELLSRDPNVFSNTLREVYKNNDTNQKLKAYWDSLEKSPTEPEELAVRTNTPVSYVNTTPIENSPPACSRCGSTSITADKKGYGAAKGLFGAVVAGPLGLLGGFMGSKKVRITCLNCGHSWIAGSIFK